MTQDRWTAVDRYITDLLVPNDPVLSAALDASAAAGLPSINVSPAQGKLLMVLAIAQGARRILEVGTLGGYSTIWLARALAAGGRLITLEADEKHAKVALANIARAGLAEVVEVKLGPALDTLPRLAADPGGPFDLIFIDADFDLIFIDADKESYPDYLEWSLKLSRRGTLIIADNIVRKGEVIDASSPDPRVQGTRTFMERLAADPRLAGAAVQTVGSKGYDGFAIAVVTAPK